MIQKWIVLLLLMLSMGSGQCLAETWTAPDQEKAKERAKKVVPFVADYVDDCQINRRICLMDAGVSLDDVQHVYFLLDSPIIKAREDQYSPVRFAHKRHAALTNDCSKCHHFRPKDEDALETTRCSACHQDSFNPKRPERIGLKAAYHQQCMDLPPGRGQRACDL
jgi:cytochrome c553